MTEALRNEVSRTGLKLDEPKQVKLPEKTAAEEEPVSEGSSKKQVHEAAPAAAESPHETPPAEAKAEQSAPEKYTLQIGSYKTATEAATLVTEVKAHGLEPWVQEVALAGKGKWYRVYLGRFGSKTEAEQMGARYQSQHVVQSFVLALLDRKR